MLPGVRWGQSRFQFGFCEIFLGVGVGVGVAVAVCVAVCVAAGVAVAVAVADTADVNPLLHHFFAAAPRLGRTADNHFRHRNEQITVGSFVGGCVGNCIGVGVGIGIGIGIGIDIGIGIGIGFNVIVVGSNRWRQ